MGPLRSQAHQRVNNADSNVCHCHMLSITVEPSAVLCRHATWRAPANRLPVQHDVAGLLAEARAQAVVAGLDVCQSRRHRGRACRAEGASGE